MLQRLGKYEILRPLGQGAMGEVFLAFDPVLGREVALKKILPAVIRGAQAEQRFRREAAAAAQLNHPNVVTIFDFDKHQDVHFLVMEYVRGRDLHELLQQHDLSQEQCLEVLAQVCEGLADAHRNGVIHRDIKPSNIRVVQEGERLLAKVLDFGIAKANEGGDTASGLLVGTVQYMAPEYIRSSRATPQSDLYSVGVVLYECLTGTRPFASDSTTTTLFKIVTETIPPLDPRVIHGISPQVGAVLERALAKDPEQRFGAGDDFAKALRACRDPHWSGAPLAVGAARSPGAGSPRAHRAILFTAAGALVAIALAGIAVRVHRPRTSAPALSTPIPGTVPAGSAAQSLPARASMQVSKVPAGISAKPTVSLLSAVPVVAPAPAPVIPPAAQPAPEEGPEDRYARAMAMLREDPEQAAHLLQSLAQPGDVRIQGHYLAALYRSRNAPEFERAFQDARASGLTLFALLKIPAFKAAIQEEMRLYRNRSLNRVLSDELMARVLTDLAAHSESEPSK